MIFENAPKVFLGDNEDFHRLVIGIYNISHVASIEGILALDDMRTEAFSDLKCDEVRSFCQKMLDFMLDAFDVSMLEELARSYIGQSNLNDEELMCLMFAADGFIKIVEGWHEEMLIRQLLFKMGYQNQRALYEKILMDFHENYSLATFCEENLKQDECCKDISDKDELGLAEIMGLSDEELCRLLDEFSIEEWALAMKVAEDCVQSRVFKLLSKIQASTLKNLMQFSGPVMLKDIEQVQRQIKEKIGKKMKRVNNAELNKNI